MSILMEPNKLKLEGNVKIKITYDDKNVLIQTLPTNWTVKDYGNSTLWSSDNKDQDPVFEKMMAFENLVLAEIIEQKDLFFEKQRKLKVSPDDIRQMWCSSARPGVVKIYPAKPGDTNIPSDAKKKDDGTFIVQNKTLTLHGSHVWITKQKAGILWTLVDV